MFNEVMLDIETLGTKPGSVIVTIGACAFNLDTGQVSNNTFLVNIHVASSVKAGLTMDPITVLWWMNQSDEARHALTAKNALLLETALLQFSNWIGEIRKDAPQNKIGIWGNDNTFDLVLTEHCYDAAGITVPWSYWESRSVRTLVELGRRKGFDPKRDAPFEGVKHNAVADAIHQAKYCVSIYNLLQG